MRFGHWLSVPALLIFTSSVAYTYQQDTLAEQAFKNIKVLKGKKASDVIPSMEFMCSSLKVDCNYCHTEDKSSDQKEEKNTAREMVLMQNEINEKNFGGRLQVTCATCHAGHTHPMNLPPVMGAETRARRAPNESAAKILDAYAKTVGTTPAPTTLELQGQTEAMGKKVAIHEVHSGAKFFVETAGKRVGFNGTAAWFGMPKGSVTIPSEYATSFINQQTLVLGPASLPKITNPTAGTAKLGSRDMLVVSGLIEGSKNRVSIFFDKLTTMPARITFTYPTILGSIPQINDFSDYKKVNGMLVPTTIGRHSSEEDTVAHFTSIRTNGKVADGIFDPTK